MQATFVESDQRVAVVTLTRDEWECIEQALWGYATDDADCQYHTLAARFVWPYQD